MTGEANENRHDLLAGRTAVVWSAWSLPFLIAFDISVVFLFVSIFVAPHLPPAGHNLLTASVAWLCFLSAASTLSLRWTSMWKGSKERAAGYTTALGNDLNFDQVSPLDGTIIRRAGEPFLAGEHIVEAKMLLRSARRFRRQP